MIKENGEERAGTLDLVGGAVCLDFVNTVGDHNAAQPDEYLTSYAALVAWSEHTGLIAPRAARQLLQEAARRPAEAEQTRVRAIALREALYRIFSAIAADAKPKTVDMDLLNAHLAEALAHQQIVSAENAFRWDWTTATGALDLMLWPIARSAADLLTADKLAQVRECSGETCGWLFVDVSKNHSRRWCSMSDCGNRAKVQRFNARKRATPKRTRR
ncbi:MAG: ABATE domain-containing protein [Chloroflexi bacterium]|nr:ABATE domain-containing protein [Chloroflexota bacterium]